MTVFEENFAMVLFGVVGAIGGLFIGRAYAQNRLKKLRDLQKVRKKEKEAAVALAAEYERKLRENQEQCRADLAQAIVQVQEAAESRFQRTIIAQGPEGLDQRLRDAQMVQSHIGRVLTVRVYLVSTGRLALEWMIEPSLPTPLTVICCLNGSKIFIEFAFRGLWSSILPLGQDLVFSFQALDGAEDRENGLQFRLRIPTEEELKRKVNPAASQEIDDAAQRREKIRQEINLWADDDEAWEKGRRELHQQTDSTDATEEEKRRRKARVDARIAERRDAQDQ